MREWRSALVALLAQIQDVERIANRVCLGRTHPKELRALASLPRPGQHRRAAARAAGQPADRAARRAGGGELATCAARCDRDSVALLADDPPVQAQRRRRDPRWRRQHAWTSCADWPATARSGSRHYEQRERERTGIRTLKVKLHRRLRLLHRGQQGQRRTGAAGLQAPPDAGQRRALHHAGAVARARPTLQERRGQLLARETRAVRGLCHAVVAARPRRWPRPRAPRRCSTCC